MKILVFVVTVAVAAVAQAKEVQVQGGEARKIMESVAASGFDVSNLDDEWSGKTLEVRTGPVGCVYSGAYFPDEWLSSVSCSKGYNNTGKRLKNPFSLAQVIAPYADFDAGVGSRWLQVDDISCSLIYDTKEYSCKITTSSVNP